MTNPMEIYELLKKIGPEAKSEADAFMKSLTAKYTPENPTPSEVIQKGLEEIVAKHGIKAEDSAHIGTPPGRMRYAAGLAAVLITVALASSGIPYMPLPLY